MCERPIDVAERPAMTPAVKTDVLSDVLRAVRLTGAAYFDFELSSPWVREAPRASDLAGIVMPGADRVIEYHVVDRGSCWGHAIGQTPVRLEEGDVIVFPQGDAHVLSSAPGMRETVDLSAFPRRSASLPVFHEMGGGGADRARIVCCFLGCDERPYNPLLTTLPPVIHLRAGGPDSQTRWLSRLMGTAATEARSARPGGDNVLSRLSELLFVETVRQYLERLPEAETGWLAGLRDPIVGHALALLHADPAAAWTVEQLARAVAISRSVLAERFAGMVGQPPMQYLTLWRMQLASQHLLSGEAMAAVADAVGYESEAAFSRAFKKIVGESPGGWRKRKTPRPVARARGFLIPNP
jgi:AraC-like DNA-binding protein